LLGPIGWGSNRATKNRSRSSLSPFFLFRVFGKGRRKEKPETKAAGGPNWNAALYRYCFAFWAMKSEKRKNKSGGKVFRSATERRLLL
jgi:hypothetical protein